MRVAAEIGRTVDAREGDIGGGEFLLERIGVERREHGGDAAVGFGAAFDALDIGGEIADRRASAASPRTCSASTRHSRSLWIEIRMATPSRLRNAP